MEGPTVVIDCGSSTCRAGFGGEPTPRTVFPAVVGRTKQRVKGATSDVVYVGSEATARGRAELSIKYPVEYGIVTNWDDMETLWSFTFRELGVSPADCPVLLTEPSCNPRANREKMAQVMFETFECKELYVASRSVLSLLSTGRATGLVLSVGSRGATSVPVYEGCSLQYAINKVHVSGEDLTFYLMKLIRDAGGPQITSATLESLNLAKQKLCYVSLNYDKDIKSQDSWTVAKYKLSDGTEISLGRERFQCPEGLFNPSLVEYELPGIHDTAYYTIQKCDKDVRDSMYRNIVLAGRSTLFPGMVARLQDELSKLVPRGQEVRVFAAPPNSAWNGGSVFAASPSFRQSCVTSEEYDEYGPAMIRKKCF